MNNRAKRKTKGLSRRVQEKRNMKLKGPGENRDGFGQGRTWDDGKNILALEERRPYFWVFGTAIHPHSYQLSRRTCWADGGIKPCHYFTRGARNSTVRLAPCKRITTVHLFTPWQKVAVHYLKWNDSCKEQITTDAYNKQVSEASHPKGISFQRRTRLQWQLGKEGTHT